MPSKIITEKQLKCPDSAFVVSPRLSTILRWRVSTALATELMNPRQPI
jgi:hypothetical protein